MFLREEVTVEQSIKKSRFICVLARVQSTDELRALVSRLKKDYPQATHYCSACKIGSISHSSDDGEPAGTAGRPMLDVLNGSAADEIGAVVIRYFGGTLLGKGGLVRAYSSSVALALKKASWAESVTMGLYEIEAGYDLAGKLEGVLRSLDIEELQVSYGSRALFTFLARENPAAMLQERFSGQIEVRQIGTSTKESILAGK